ncbi:MAG: polyphenol oxidase family protein, partial [Bacteroidota bacterium]
STFFGGLGIQEDELAIPGQVHGSRIRRIDQAGRYPETDGLITATPRVFRCVTFADCVPLLLYDPVSRHAAALHAGWRGTALRIAETGVRRLVDECGADPHQLRVFMGPAAGVCCYAVGEEVSGQFDQAFVRRGSATTIDLREALKAQVLAAGCREEHLEISTACTIHDSSYHSFRRDGKRSGRMMACIGIDG